MKLNYWKFYKGLFLLSFVSIYSQTAFSQIDEDVKATKIAEKQKGEGKYTDYIRGVKHPVTTFSNEYSVNNIRDALKGELLDEVESTIDEWYVAIYDNALKYANGTLQLYLPDDYDKPGQVDPNAQAAKYAAFVCLIGLDKDGQEINFGSTTYQQLKQVAFDALTMLKDNDYNKVYDGTGKIYKGLKGNFETCFYTLN